MIATQDATRYVTCNRLLDAEANEYCEYDGDITTSADGAWTCPACQGRRRI